MTRKQFYRDLRKIIFDLEMLIDDEIEFQDIDEMGMIKEDIKELEEAIKMLKEIL